MQFKNPEILYALALLLIPIIVHLFQLRRFQKVPFTNVEFLRTVTKQTRKSQQLKKWLTLITRMLILACAIFAFAQPFSSSTDNINAESETVIYLDNSFSMQARGDRGELLKRSVQDLLASNGEDEQLTLFTNDQVFRKVSIKSVRNELLQLDYSGTQLPYDAVLLKGRQLFSKDTTITKNFVLISDFQQNKPLNLDNQPEDIDLHLVKINPVSTNNISIDSAYITQPNANNLELHVSIGRNNGTTENVPISLYDGQELVAKTAVNLESDKEAVFSLTADGVINGRLVADDPSLAFDNTLYFNLNEREKINVLSINSADDDYLKRIFTESEFNLTSVSSDQLNYNDINNQNLIVLNELESIPTALINALSAFYSDQGYILIIPSSNASLISYNQLLSGISSVNYLSHQETERLITKINFSHPLFADVFDQEVTNFQYPKVDTYIETATAISPVLQFEDNQPFLIRSGNTFVFTAALNEDNSNIINSPLIVPTIFNIGRQSLKLPELYYTIGNENTFDINTNLQQDEILKLKKDDAELIPQQRTFPKKVSVSMQDSPERDGIYEVINGGVALQSVSFNYNRSESELTYYDLESYENLNQSSTVNQMIESIKSNANIKALWKWFAIFALIFLIMEMLILKFIR